MEERLLVEGVIVVGGNEGSCEREVCMCTLMEERLKLLIL